MAIRDKLRRLEKQLRGGLASFELADGSRHFYESEQVWWELFRHHSDCIRADYRGAPRPAPSAILEAVLRAKDRRSAVGRLYASDPAPPTAYDLEELVERGGLVPRSFLAGHGYEESVGHFARKNAGG